MGIGIRLNISPSVFQGFETYTSESSFMKINDLWIRKFFNSIKLGAAAATRIWKFICNGRRYKCRKKLITKGLWYQKTTSRERKKRWWKHGWVYEISYLYFYETEANSSRKKRQKLIFSPQRRAQWSFSFSPIGLFGGIRGLRAR